MDKGAILIHCDPVSLMPHRVHESAGPTAAQRAGHVGSCDDADTDGD